jgi:hypothetical protein
MTGYSKLVRDRIPEIITANGELPKVRVLEPHEEADELGSAEPVDRLDELAVCPHQHAQRREAEGCTAPVYFSPGPVPGSSGMVEASLKASWRERRPSRRGAA